MTAAIRAWQGRFPAVKLHQNKVVFVILRKTEIFASDADRQFL
jgi:hypothetical protein